MFFISTNLRPEIAFTQIKGLYNSIPADKKQCSPLNGFNWWHIGIIENFYRFGDESHNTIKLIQEIFYLQPDNITFDVTTLPRKVAKYFKASTYGKIIALLDKYKNPLTPAKQQQLKAELYTTIISDLNFDQLVAQAQESIAEARDKLQEVEQLAQRRRKLNVLIVRYQKKLQENGPNDTWQKNIATAEEELQKIEPLVAQRKEIERSIHAGDLSKQRLDDFITYLVGSLQETNTHQYVAYTTHTILLAALWKIAQSKADFALYFKTVDPAIPIDPVLWNQEFSRAEFEIFNAQLEKDPSFINNDYELSSFYGLARQAWASDLLPIIISGIADARYTAAGKEYLFADCGESSLRNFFDIIIFNPQKEIFDFQLLLITAEKNGLTILPALRQYYARYNQMPYIQTKPYYDAWVLIAAALPGVEYNHPEDYEISPGLSNMLNAFNPLIFGNDPIYRAMSNSEKLDHLVAKLWRPGFLLSWHAQKGAHFQEDPAAPALETGHKQSININYYNVGIDIVFTINGTQQFIWKFDDDHFVIEKPEKQTSAIDNSICKVLAEKMGSAIGDLTAQNLIGWFTHADYAPETIALLPSAIDRMLVCMTLPLKNANILRESWPIILEPNGLPQAIIKRLIASYPLHSDEYGDSLGTAIIQSSSTQLYPLLGIITLGGQVIAALAQTKKSQWHPLIISTLENAYQNWDNLHDLSDYITALEDPEVRAIPGIDPLLSSFKDLITLEKATENIEEGNEDTYQRIYDDVTKIIKSPSAKLTRPIEVLAGEILHADTKSTILDDLLRTIIDSTKNGNIIYHVLEHHTERFFPTTHPYIATIPELYRYALNLVDEGDELSYTTLQQVVQKSDDTVLLKKIAEKIKTKKLEKLYPIADAILQKLPKKQETSIAGLFNTVLEYVHQGFSLVVNRIDSLITSAI